MQRRWAIDVLIVLVIVGLASLRGPDAGGDLTSWLFTLALTVPLLWRRRRPVAVFAAIATLALVQWAVGVRAFGDAALLVALYSVAVSRPLPITLAAATVLEVGVVLATLRWVPHEHPLDSIVALSGLATAAGVLGVNAGHRQALLASLRDQARLAAANERSRIARELHDIVAHNLSVMIALADGATYAVHDAPEQAELATRNASRTGRDALTEMRRLLGVLREEEAVDERAPQPGIGELDALADQVRAAGLPTSMTVVGAPPERPSGGLQLAAYRIVQEALTNTLKHAGAGAEAFVKLRWSGPRLHLEIDNTGASVTPAKAEGGGLRGMRERAAVYDGAVSAGPRPEGGWRVTAELGQIA